MRVFFRLKVSVMQFELSLIVHDRVVGATRIHGRKWDKSKTNFVEAPSEQLKCCQQQTHSSDRLIRDIKGQICKMSRDQADFYLFSIRVSSTQRCGFRESRSTSSFHHVHHRMFLLRHSVLMAACGVRAGLVHCVSRHIAHDQDERH